MYLRNWLMKVLSFVGIEAAETEFAAYIKGAGTVGKNFVKSIGREPDERCWI